MFRLQNFPEIALEKRKHIEIPVVTELIALKKVVENYFFLVEEYLWIIHPNLQGAV